MKYLGVTGVFDTPHCYLIWLCCWHQVVNSNLSCFVHEAVRLFDVSEGAPDL